MLATSGLDDDVKIWTPKTFDEPNLWDLKKVCFVARAACHVYYQLELTAYGNVFLNQPLAVCVVMRF